MPNSVLNHEKKYVDQPDSLIRMLKEDVLSNKIIVDSLRSGSAFTRNRTKTLIKTTPRNYIPHLMNNLNLNKPFTKDQIDQAIQSVGISVK